MHRDTLGDILLRKKLIDRSQLQSALAHQKTWGRPLGATLVELGFCHWDGVMEALSEQNGLPVVDWSSQNLGGELAALLPRRIAERCRAVPLGLEGSRREVLVVAVAAPAPLTTLDELRLAGGKHRIRAMLAADADIERALAIVYRSEEIHAAAVAGAKNAGVSAGNGGVPPLATPQLPSGGYALRRNIVLLLGWHAEVAKKLKNILGPAGYLVRPSTSEEILMADANDLVIAPLPAAEALVVGGTRFPARLVVIGRNPLAEAGRARALGALSFLSTPLDPGELVRAVQSAAVPTAPAGKTLKN